MVRNPGHATPHGDHAGAGAPSHIHFQDLLLRSCKTGANGLLLTELEQAGRRAAAEGGPIERVLSTVRSAAADVSDVLDGSMEDSAQRLQAERRLRRVVEDLTQAIIVAFAQQSAKRITTLEELDASLATRVKQLTAIQQVNSAANSSLDLSRVLELTVQAVQHVTSSDLCSVYLYDDRRNDLVLRSSTGLSQRVIGRARMLLGEGITGWAAQTGKPVAVADAWADPHFKYIPGSDEEPYRSMLSVPIILFTVHKLVGVLNLQTKAAREWSNDETSFVETVAGQVAMAIENARLYRQTDDELRQKVEQLTTLQRVSALVASSLDVKMVMDSIASHLRDLGNADMSALFAYDPSQNDFHIVASRGLSKLYREVVRVPMHHGVVSEAVKTRNPVIVDDALVDDRLSTSREEIEREGYRSLLAIPLITRRGALGVAVLYTALPHRFAAEDASLLSAFTNEAAIALENAKLYEEVRQGLDEKSTLLAEMHHRVKNNLQTIAALLSMQQRRAKVESERTALAESVARIQSIAAIHDLLSHKDIGVARVRDVVQQVVTSVTSALSAVEVTVHFAPGGEQAQMASKEATVLALAINELVTNCVQHGFAGRERGSITVAITEGTGSVTVMIADDGRGLAPDFRLETQSGLGMQIVRTLVENDLHGHFQLTSNHGAVATLRFPVSPLTRQAQAESVAMGYER